MSSHAGNGHEFRVLSSTERFSGSVVSLVSHH